MVLKTNNKRLFVSKELEDFNKEQNTIYKNNRVIDYP